MKIHPISECKPKKGIINQTISIFILVLMVVVISGFTYWFIAEFKDTIATTATGGNQSTAWQAVNDTEAASLNIIDLLPFIFMALGFVIIIGVLIRILVPIMNLGNSFGGGGF